MHRLLEININSYAKLNVSIKSVFYLCILFYKIHNVAIYITQLQADTVTI